MPLELYLILRSDATFGRGDGIVGLVDEEVEHDALTGLPFLRGRTLKGLLVEECANILFSLETAGSPGLSKIQNAAAFLFGRPGSTLEDDGRLHIGPALLPEPLRKAVEVDIEAGRLRPDQVTESLTAIRRQTAVDERTGAPLDGSLRSERVILRDTPFHAYLEIEGEPVQGALELLAACILSLRRAGDGRNRGRGKLSARLLQNAVDISAESFTRFCELAGGTVL